MGGGADTAEVRANVIAPFHWQTHVMVLASKKGYRTRWGGSSAGSLFGSSSYKLTQSGNSFRTIWCSYQILIVRSGCDAGEYASAPGVCHDCPNGQYSVIAAESCAYDAASCPAGTAPTPPAACDECEPGKFSTGSAAACSLCPAGFYSSIRKSTSCTACPSGYHSVAGSTKCSGLGGCGTQNWIRLASSLAGQQLIGRVEICWKGVWGTVCDDYFGSNDARVLARDLGEANVVAYTCCNRYTAPYISWSTPIHLDDLRCWGTEDSIEDCASRGWGRHNCGHSEDVGLSVSCPVGRFGRRDDDGYFYGCQSCPSGWFTSAGGAALCTKCEPGQYSAETSSPACSSCESGRYSVAGAASCEYNRSNCPFGTVANASISGCVECAPGRFHPGGDACDECPAGYSQEAYAMQECELCDPGKYASATEMANCSSCAAGRASSTPGATSAGSCLECPLGRRSSIDNSICQGCTAGKYGDETGKAVCKRKQESIHSDMPPRHKRPPACQIVPLEGLRLNRTACEDCAAGL